jgi:hypothetical protein
MSRSTTKAFFLVARICRPDRRANILFSGALRLSIKRFWKRVNPRSQRRAFTSAQVLQPEFARRERPYRSAAPKFDFDPTERASRVKKAPVNRGLSTQT